MEIIIQGTIGFLFVIYFLAAMAFTAWTILGWLYFWVDGNKQDKPSIARTVACLVLFWLFFVMVSAIAA